MKTLTVSVVCACAELGKIFGRGRIELGALSWTVWFMPVTVHAARRGLKMRAVFLALESAQRIQRWTPWAVTD